MSLIVSLLLWDNVSLEGVGGFKNVDSSHNFFPIFWSNKHFQCKHKYLSGSLTIPHSPKCIPIRIGIPSWRPNLGWNFNLNTDLNWNSKLNSWSVGIVQSKQGLKVIIVSCHSRKSLFSYRVTRGGRGSESNVFNSGRPLIESSNRTGWFSVILVMGRRLVNKCK